MDGITAIQSRMTEITALMSSMRAQPTSTARGVLGASADQDFAATLEAASGTYSTLASAAAGLNADGVPTAFAGYGNGRIPESALAPITGSTERMWVPAATHLNSLIADAKAAGVTIGVTDGYRDYDAQVRLAQTKGLYSQGGLAATPGTSEHGWGLAVDLKLDATAQAWMRANGAKYGFVEAVAREPWHWEFQPDKV